MLEKHRDFVENGFHSLFLLKGVESIPYKEVIKPLWKSATHYVEETGEGAENGWIERIRSAKAIGYVTKYLTKTLPAVEVGTRQVERERLVTLLDEEGEVVGFERQKEVVEAPSKAHRIRYSRNFFPERVAALRKRLFEGLEKVTLESWKGSETGSGKPLENGEQKQRPAFQLVKRNQEDWVDVEEYKRRRYAEFLAELEEVREQDSEEYKRLKRLALAQLMKEVGEVVRVSYAKQKRKV